MASNSKTEARKVKAAQGKASFWDKFYKDLSKITSAGEEICSHYVGGGQAFTRKAANKKA